MSESGGKLRIVLDTNLFVSGVISRIGLPRRVLDAWLDQRFNLLLSGAHRTELEDVFSRPNITEKYRIAPERLGEIFTSLASAERVIPADVLPISVRDANDEKILAAALGGKADFLVTGDKDLLVLAGNPRLNDLKIVTVGEFMAALGLAEGERGDLKSM